MELFTAVELFTQAITYLMIVAGFPSCISMIRTKNTKGVPYPYFLAGTVNSTVSIAYGLLVNNPTLVQINVFATCCNLFYILSFIFISRSKRKPVTQVLACGAIVLCIYLYTTKLIQPSAMQDTFGVILLMCSTVLLLTPLLAVKQSIDDKSAANIPISMLIPGLLCCSSWFLYGFLLNDVYIYGPNILGTSSMVCQVGAILVYGTKSTERPHAE
ncbi:hypothetical protein ACF0H5_013608 [Mactra antiquata]